MAGSRDPSRCGGGRVGAGSNDPIRIGANILISFIGAGILGLPYAFKKVTYLLYLARTFCNFRETPSLLKVDGNEKRGGSARRLSSIISLRLAIEGCFQFERVVSL